MNSRRPLVTKIVYVVLIALLLVPLSLLSRPSLRTENEFSAGGKLDQLRTEYKLSQSTLGEIDPTSETIRLASLGMRGVAANILWHKANHYKKVEDWTNLSAAVEQITKLQPNFFKIWDFQSHNLSYNISTQFDDYRDRYKWVVKGIEFLEDGQELNNADPRFENRLGWITGQKIGRADERVQYRRLFRADDDYHGERRPADRDNWLVAHDWYKLAESKVKDPTLIRGSTPVLFYSEAAKALINYGEALETDGRFGDIAKTAWQSAADEFATFGQRLIPTTFGYNIQLDLYEAEKQRIEDLTQELEALAPGVFEKLRNEKIEKLSQRERDVLNKPHELRNPDEHEIGLQIERKIFVRPTEAAELVPADQLVRAREIAVEIAQLQETSATISRYRDIVNYAYWRARSKAGFDDDWQLAQEHLFNAGEHLKATRFADARVEYEASFQHWRKILDRYDELRNESITLDDLVADIEKYRRTLAQEDLEFPKNFILQDILDEREGITTSAISEAGDTPATSEEAVEAESANEAATPAPAETPVEKPATETEMPAPAAAPEAMQLEMPSPETASPETPAVETPAEPVSEAPAETPQPEAPKTEEPPAAETPPAPAEQPEIPVVEEEPVAAE